MEDIGGHGEVGWYLGLARNGAWGTSGELDLVCSEAVLSRGRGPGIHKIISMDCLPQTSHSIEAEPGRLVFLGRLFIVHQRCWLSHIFVLHRGQLDFMFSFRQSFS